MANGILEAICIGPAAKAAMVSINEVVAIARQGLAGDRYTLGKGSFNDTDKGRGGIGHRQVTLINAMFVDESGFSCIETRRNLIVRGIELMDQIGHEFRIDDVLMRGLAYCDPCMKPTTLIGSPYSFREKFYERGGLVAEILEGGIIRVGSIIKTRKKSYSND
jgi:MOSC domain-containing protein YiiM